MITVFSPIEERIKDLQCSLAQRVPDMKRGFSITTCYGEINIDPEFAEEFRSLATKVLKKQLNQLIRL